MYKVISFMYFIFLMSDVQASCKIPFYLQNEMVCRYYLNDYFSFKMDSKQRRKLNILISEACTCLRKEETAKPFFCVDAFVQRTKGNPLNMLEKCVRKYKGQWSRF
jgi:hypothetical protein